MKLQKALMLFLLGGTVLQGPGAAEFSEGRIKLVLHESTGRFSLYYMTDIVKDLYEPLFLDRDPRTSFITVMTGDRTYRLGEASAFKVRLGGVPAAPAFIFESPFLRVTEEFSFIQTVDSSLTNGVRINITIENRSEQQTVAGLRFLLDTTLGENSQPHFATNTRSFVSEAVIDGGNSDRWWISRNDRFGFMGSVFVGGVTKPDLVHFANWKRLNDIPWKTSYVSGRNFNYLPYSIGDSAVCYYYDPAPLGRGAARTVTILLAAEDQNGFAQYSASAQDELTKIVRRSVENVEGNGSAYTQEDLLLLRDLIARIDAYIAAGAVTDEELMTIELVLSQIKARHSP